MQETKPLKNSQPAIRSRWMWWIWSPYLNPCAAVVCRVFDVFWIDLFCLVSVAVDALMPRRTVCWSPHVAANTWCVQWCENMGKWRQREEGAMREEWGENNTEEWEAQRACKALQKSEQYSLACRGATLKRKKRHAVNLWWNINKIYISKRK